MLHIYITHANLCVILRVQTASAAGIYNLCIYRNSSTRHTSYPSGAGSSKCPSKSGKIPV